jgi:phosphomannomutase
MKSTLFIILSLILLTSCKDDNSVDTNKEAVNLSFDEVLNYPSFLDFESVYNNYSLDENYIDSIKSAISSDDKIYLYLKPDCGCTVSYKLFPSVVKTLDSAGFSEDNIKYYIMESEENPYPESDFINITDLPQFFVANDNGVFDITNTSDTILIEQVIYNSLK